MARKKFIRASAHRFSKLGLRRKKKQIYRKSKGRDNKTRLNRIGRVENVRIGHGHDRKVRGLHQGDKVVIVNNVSELKKLNDKEVAIIGSIGKKKKMEIAKYAQDNKIKLKNMNVGEFVKKVEDERKMKKDKKMSDAEKKKARDKASKEKDKKDKDSKKKDDSKKEDKLEEKVEDKKDVSTGNSRKDNAKDSSGSEKSESKSNDVGDTKKDDKSDKKDEKVQDEKEENAEDKSGEKKE
jgi:ribosomal protein L32E